MLWRLYSEPYTSKCVMFLLKDAKLLVRGVCLNGDACDASCPRCVMLCRSGGLGKARETRAPARSPARKLPLERKKDAGKTSKSTEADSCNKSSLG